MICVDAEAADATPGLSQITTAAKQYHADDAVRTKRGSRSIQNLLPPLNFLEVQAVTVAHRRVVIVE